MDIITELSELAFASRLKRLSERLSKDVSRLYRNLEMDFEARWFAILYSLDQHSPMAVTQLAQSLGLTHTAIKLLTNEMIKQGYLYSLQGKKDERQRFLFISEKGKTVAQKLAPVWEEIRLATKELIETSGCDFLSVIGKIEQKLNEQDMFDRVWLRLKGRPPGKVKIREYSPALKKYFKSLNYEWLEEYFKVEKIDKQLLSDPKGKIVKKGGSIFFACIDDQIVGTAALIKHKDGTLELAKMAVTKRFQERGLGQKLIQKIIDKARELGGDALYLQTNSKLKAANHLYQKFGFQKTNKSPFDAARYQRPTYVMKLNLKKI